MRHISHIVLAGIAAAWSLAGCKSSLSTESVDGPLAPPAVVAPPEENVAEISTDAATGTGTGSGSGTGTGSGSGSGDTVVGTGTGTGTGTGSGVPPAPLAMPMFNLTDPVDSDASV